MAKSKTSLKVSASVNGEEPKEIDMEAVAEQMRKQNALSSKYVLKKAKIIDSMFLYVEYSEITPDKNDVSKTCSAPIHADLKAQFSRLDSHITNLCFQFDEEGNLTHKECFCTNISVGKDNNGVTLSGRRKFEDGKGINLTAPFARYEDNPGIEHIIEALKQEVFLYLFESKHAPDAQLNLFDEKNKGSDDDDETM